MITFEVLIEKFGDKGEKTGWTYIYIPENLALQIKAGTRTSYRVKGFLDNIPVSGLAMVPMGEGDYIIALKGELRRKLRKKDGDLLKISLEEHSDFTIDMPADLEECLNDQPHLIENFLKQPRSHQHYYFNWINSAKTDPTRAKRIAMTVNAMDRGYDFGQMLREEKKKKVM
ncbi:DUF1905 domain-containing protein [Flavihumibacter sp. R14]|nr:DUF1905 domain-containing protein [Flavihumibacter soli]